MLSINEQVHFSDNLDFFAKQVVEGFLTGLHKSPYHGFSVEFAEHRLYNQGDPIKHVDWKLFGRSDKLFVKKFEEETNLRSFILLDTSSSMYFPEHKNNQISKLEFSIFSSASLMNLFLKQRDGFGLTLYSENLDFFTPAKCSKSHYNRLIAELDKLLVKPNDFIPKATNFHSSISNFIEKIPQRSLVIIFSDMMNFDNDDSYVESFQHLRHRKNEVLLFHVQDFNQEKLFNFSNRPHQFVDLENNQEVKLNPINFQETYRNLYDSFQKKIELECNKYHIEYIPSFINDSFSKVLSAYLIKRSKLF
ncbi:MAG: DUF58 domain-containing protein [Flavobacteriales bacterium]|nr:DUF58 domain-containing protein [Flavobacteriales bacterium]|tara:strand:- start:18264 stop:19181 length:918 start_codon:yes stop_codon:yes gene_type:complete